MLGLMCLAALAFLLYGRHLGSTYLADDFLFLRWSDEGIVSLLRHTTVASNPQVIRPLPALLWLMGGLRNGYVFHHLVLIVVHLANGLLIAKILSEIGKTAEASWFIGAAFVAFPYSVEPVAWLSAGPDVLACFFALASMLYMLRSSISRATLGLSLLSYALAMFCKESVLLLPGCAFLLFTGRIRTRAYSLHASLFFVYIFVRLFIFGGIGGYDVQSSSIVQYSSIVRFLRNVTLQLPFRLLVPMKGLESHELFLLGLSVTLYVLLIISLFSLSNSRLILRSASAFILALAPVMQILSVDPDHGSSRLLYFPAAVAAIGVGLQCCAYRKLFRYASITLLLYWSVAVLHNGTSWTIAGEQMQSTVAAVRANERTFPTGSIVFIDGSDTYQGAFLFRNAVPALAYHFRFREDLTWMWGSCALLERPSWSIGRSVFEIGALEEDLIGDRTNFQHALYTSDKLSTSERVQIGHSALKRRYDGRYRMILDPIAIKPGTEVLVVQIWVQNIPSDDRADVTAHLSWRFDLSRSFNTTYDRRFRLSPRANTRAIVPVFPPHDATEIGLEITASSREDFSRIVSVGVEAVPEATLQ